MSQLVSGQSLIDAAYKRSDNDGATERHPRTDVLGYVNAGGAELYDLLVEARGRSYFRKRPPQTITTAASTSQYALASDFYRLISVRLNEPGGDVLQPYRAEDEPWLRESSSSTDWPTFYELQNGYIELLPLHKASLSVILDYVPVFTALADNGTPAMDAINYWHEYVICFAAKCMAIRDEDFELVRAITEQMNGYRARIKTLAPTRDAFRAEKVKDTRGKRWWLG